MTPLQLVLKLTWENEMPASSDYSRMEKKVCWGNTCRTIRVADRLYVFAII
jgi:hypothetical protein